MPERKNHYGLVHGPMETYAPAVYTPLTRMMEHWFTYSDTACAQHERLLIRCAFQMSKDQMYKKCSKELDDFDECINKKKQLARYTLIQKEREKQNKFEKPPPPGSYIDDEKY
ncbi:hypothetical protein EB796_009261 [Bugula neritina]|uniref:Uncharacterized protein n=1 Tax=Bugula neritina TaxID=10212 RepID=A0A7J7K2K5_BUGNE|nr:hypothetical protein EB796_009261 [Bugula neritina]